MEYWQAFLRFDFADETLMICGAALVSLGVIKIVRSSIKLLFWVLLSALGVVSVSYGMNRSAYDLPALEQLQLSDLSSLRPSMSVDVLRLLCIKLEESEL